MSLEFHRARLLMWLQTANCFGSARDYGFTMALIKQWWAAYKAWERQDTFVRAFTEQRLSVTQRPFVAKEVPGRTVDLLATSKADPQGPKVVHGRTLEYRTDVASFKDRLKPENFRRTEGSSGELRRMKYELGLHDMSASLLDPVKATVSEQLRWKPTAKGKGVEWAVVFMPLPLVEDLATFELVNYAARQVKDKAPTVYRAVVYMRRRMTRVKFAQETDMGAGLLDTGAPNGPHLRYGATDFQTEKNRLNIDVPVYRAGISQVRRQKAREYNTILARQREVGSLSNEIIVAYREHASPRFPIIAAPHDAGAWYEVEGEQAAYYRGSRIDNVWRLTAEHG